MPRESKATPGVRLPEIVGEPTGSRSGVGSRVQRGIFFHGVRAVFLGGVCEYNSDEQSMCLLILWGMVTPLGTIGF